MIPVRQIIFVSMVKRMKKLPIRASEVRQYMTADAFCLIAYSLYATDSPDLSSRVRTRFDILSFLSLSLINFYIVFNRRRVH